MFEYEEKHQKYILVLLFFVKMKLRKVFLGDKRIAREFIEKYESKN